MVIGNWQVNEDVIVWIGKPQVDYEIPINELTHLGHGDRSGVYDWLIHLSEKTWITRQDMNDLYKAVVKTCERDQIEYDQDTLLDTVSKIMREMGNDNSTEIDIFNFK